MRWAQAVTWFWLGNLLADLEGHYGHSTPADHMLIDLMFVAIGAFWWAFSAERQAA